MIRVSDGPLGLNDWAHIDWDNNELWFEESNVRKPFTTSHCLMDRGKYEGYKLSEVTDTWYLKFIRDKNPDDALIRLMFGRRLKEIE